MLDSDVGGANISVAEEPFIDGDKEGMLQLSGECLSLRATLTFAVKKKTKPKQTHRDK
jgi:hypothetical protein